MIKFYMQEGETPMESPEEQTAPEEGEVEEEATSEEEEAGV